MKERTLTLASMQRSGAVLSICVTLFFLVLCGFTMGISQADDSFYLASGLTQPISFFFKLHNWSPLYFTWFHMLGLVCPDPVWRYFLSWVLEVLPLALLPTMLKIRYAWIYTLCLLVPTLPAAMPYIGMFAGMMGVLALCLALRARPRFAEALAASCVACFVIAECRAEYDYGVLLAGVATLVALALELRPSVRLRQGPQFLSRVCGLVLIATVLPLLTVYIMHHAIGQARSGIAFAQHFNVRAALRGEMPYDGRMWQSNYAERMFGIDLDHTAANTAATIGDYFRANPTLFLKHILANVTDVKAVFTGLLVLFAVVYPWWWPASRGLRPVSLFLAVLAMPVLIDIAVIFPRDHYFLSLLPAVILFALQAIRSERLAQPRVPLVLVTAMAAMTFVVLAVPRLRHKPVSPELVSLSEVECVRAVDRTVSPSNSVVLNSVWIENVYLAPGRTQVKSSTLPQWDGLKAWAVEKRPAWITVSDTFAADYGVTPAQVEAFLGGELGYQAHACPARAQMTVYVPRGQ